jgi:TPR repeat protein
VINKSLAEDDIILYDYQGITIAQFNYGLMLYTGDGIVMSKSLAAYYFKLSADQGDAQSQSAYGMMLRDGDGIVMNKSLAAYYFKLSADQGDAHSQFAYGIMLRDGDGIVMNKSLAAYYFKLSADQGIPTAQFNYGLMLRDGDGIVMNKSLAADYFKLSADQGIPKAQFNYGVMLRDGDGIVMNKSLAAYCFKLSADQGDSSGQIDSAIDLVRHRATAGDFGECERYLRSAADDGDEKARLRLGLGLFSGVFGRFDFAEARHLFAHVSQSCLFASVLRDSMLSSECEMIYASEFCRSGNLFGVLRSSIDETIGLIQVLNPNLSPYTFNESDHFEAWQATTHCLFPYLIDVSEAQSHRLSSFPSDLLSCQTILMMIPFVFRIYTIESLLYKNINRFLRHFPMSMVSKFLGELKGILHYIYLLQSSVEILSETDPIQENLIVYRGVKQCGNHALLYESLIGDIVVWPGFTSSSTNRDLVLRRFITPDDSILFEIELHPGDVAARIEQHSEYGSEGEVLIAASTGFQVLSVDFVDVTISSNSSLVALPIVRLSYALHWYDFDLNQRPPTVIVGGDCSS